MSTRVKAFLTEWLFVYKRKRVSRYDRTCIAVRKETSYLRDTV